MSLNTTVWTQYTTLSLDQILDALEALIGDTESRFGHLDTRQLNWKPDAHRWSVAQCLEHLVTGDALLLERASDALRNPHRTLWQRAPLLPRMWGQLLIRSQGPQGKRKFTAPTTAEPSASEIGADIVQRFVEQHRAASTWIRALSDDDVAHAIMISPFVRFIAYSVADGLRLMVAHDRRHFNQALHVMDRPEFPRRHEELSTIPEHLRGDSG